MPHIADDGHEYRRVAIERFCFYLATGWTFAGNVNRLVDPTGESGPHALWTILMKKPDEKGIIR